MKHFIVFCFFFLLCFSIAEAQTFADIPGPENVLLVYKQPSGPTDTLGRVSDSVMNYYQNARNIPASNILGLDNLVNATIYDSVSQTEHYIKLTQSGEIIKDTNNQYTWSPTIHSWIYFNEKIVKPIRSHLLNTYVNGTQLKDIIRFIVLCKGVPYRIEARKESGDGCRNNVPIDGLLNIIGETFNDEDAILDFYYPTTFSQFQFAYTLPNPYFNADPSYNMAHHFLPNSYSAQITDQSTINFLNRNSITISYLVSHLDGFSYEDITGMIDRSIDALHADGYDWLIDADPTPDGGGSVMIAQASATENSLSNLGFHNYKFDYLTDTILVNYYKPIMSYSSNGTHTTLGGYSAPRYFEPDYIQSQLEFEYAPGAVFNTAESFNATTIGSSNPIPRRDGQGQIPEFFLMGGTVGVGHAYEPKPENMVKDYIMIPAYQLGYSFIEAAYLGMPNLTTENVVVGDPLCTIVWGKQTLPDSIVFESTNLIAGELNITGNAAIINNGAALRFKHNGFITGEGYLISQDREYTLETTNWNKSVFKSKYDNHPMIIWAPYPGEEIANTY
ncbi:MAG: hypothetical protein K8H86_13985, partial [Ignavibacteriaceae bacterium]|nr:hypothetical protein [Ignavibacteriaceae bacterium]